VNVTVRYSAQAQAAAGVASESVPLDGARTVRELVARLAERHGEPLRRLLLRADGAPAAVLIVVGDEQVRFDDPRPLRDGDVVSLLTPISGG
jgi:molybdopterin converting factor small subunit